MFFILFCFFSALSYGRLAPLLENKLASPLDGRYIVVYHESVTNEEFEVDHVRMVGDNLLHKYTAVFKGFSATLTKEQLDTVRNNPLVKHVEVDQLMRASACSPEVVANSWGLTRIAETNHNLDGFYSYPSEAGAGVMVYVVDTGILVEHHDFGGRASFGWKAERQWSDTDGNGHGTHVASTAVGTNYGVAKSARVKAVKVLGDNGSGSNAGVLAGVDWVIGQHVSVGGPSVINLSLGGGSSASLNAAVDAAVDEGIVVVVAAGNSNTDACSSSPASAKNVVSVGSTDTGINNADVRSYFSNFGTCVDVFAPGSDITAAWIGKSNTAINTISGTSMASPHVAGIAALLLSGEPSASSKAIQARLIGTATPGKIQLECTTTPCRSSPNLMAFNGCNRH